eukprot:Hpha_TRINITY_DN10028_c0_g1::TRINITY_DN10028_c0_g1_i1::g.83859::m.83859
MGSMGGQQYAGGGQGGGFGGGYGGPGSGSGPQLTEGMRVIYNGYQGQVPAQIVHVDRIAVPPAYTIRFPDGSERQTEAERLVQQQGTGPGQSNPFAGEEPAKPDPFGSLGVSLGKPAPAANPFSGL